MLRSQFKNLADKIKRDVCDCAVHQVFFGAESHSGFGLVLFDIGFEADGVFIFPGFHFKMQYFQKKLLSHRWIARDKRPFPLFRLQN
jgi:hypothetical protein